MGLYFFKTEGATPDFPAFGTRKGLRASTLPVGCPAFQWLPLQREVCIRSLSGIPDWEEAVPLSSTAESRGAPAQSSALADGGRTPPSAGPVVHSESL